MTEETRKVTENAFERRQRIIREKLFDDLLEEYAQIYDVLELADTEENFSLTTLEKVRNQKILSIESKIIHIILKELNDALNKEEKDQELIGYLLKEFYKYIDVIALDEEHKYDISFIENDSRLYQEICQLREVIRHNDISQLLEMITKNHLIIKNNYVSDTIITILYSTKYYNRLVNKIPISHMLGCTCNDGKKS
jgi:hypothetical protein